MPAIHHNPNKQASVTFWTRGEFKRLNFIAKDRAAAIAYVKTRYPGATKISVVFFVKAGEI